MSSDRNRLKINAMFDMLDIVSGLSPSQRDRVGCIAFRLDFSRIAAFGYNGRYPGCPINPETNGEELSLEPGKSGFIHAEVNMVAKFREPDPENYVVLVSLSPCLQCAQVLATAGFKHVYWVHNYRETSHLHEIFDANGILYGEKEAALIQFT